MPVRQNFKGFDAKKSLDIVSTLPWEQIVFGVKKCLNACKMVVVG